MHPETTHFTGDILRIEQVIDILLLTLLVLAAVLLQRASRRGAFRDHRSVILVTVLTSVLALGLRLWLFPPSFVHANFRGPRLVDAILAAPARPAESLGAYGQLTFLVLGGIARFAGVPRFETVAWTNAVFGVLSLALVGALAVRWTGRPLCAPLAVAVGALQPALGRIACSEDAHVLGAFFGLVALVAIDVYATRRDRVTLALAATATALMVGSRQTYYPWAPCVVAMGVARGGTVMLRRPEVILAALFIALSLALRLAATAINEPAQLTMLPAALTGARIVWALLCRHPLFDVGRFALGFLPLEVLGLFAMRDARMRRACLAFFFVTFLVTLPFGFPLPGVECSFRTPVLLLALVFAASGAERLWRARPLGLAPLGLAIASPLALPTWRDLRERTPVTREYLFVRDVASPLLPRRFTLAEIPAVDPMPSYRLAASALTPGVVVTRKEALLLTPGDEAREPTFFLAGLQCRARSALELGGYTGKAEALSLDALRDVAWTAILGRVPGGTAPSATRDECARILAGAEPFGPELVIERPAEENPFALYSDAPVPVRFWRLRRTGP